MTDTARTLITVVIPTYGARGALARAVDSALAQQGVDLDVVVVDDNNPDTPARKATQAIMDAYAADSRVRYICHQHNRNGAAARNTGIHAAKGEYVAFLDDDDMFLPGKLRAQLDYLNANPQFDAVYCLACRDGKALPATPYEGNASEHILMMEASMYTPTLMMRRQALLHSGAFDESFRRHQDYQMLLSFFRHGHRIGCLQQVYTELGGNEGENYVTGEALNKLKKNFLGLFATVIDRIDKEQPGFRNRVYARHYAAVFLQHVKGRHWGMALGTLKYFFKSPSTFTKVLTASVRAHL